jgi:hypothetical protein
MSNKSFHLIRNPLIICRVNRIRDNILVNEHMHITSSWAVCLDPQNRTRKCSAFSAVQSCLWCLLYHVIITYVYALLYLMYYLKYRASLHLKHRNLWDACKDLGPELDTENEADYKGFWRWCITSRITGALDSVSHLPDDRSGSRFRNVVFSVF